MSGRPPNNRQNSTRRDIALLAARLMAEDGIDDYGLAKRKAARQLGVPESEGLPANSEIEEALRAYQSLYQEEEQVERIHFMRSAALDVMRALAPFRVYLTGPVLDGTAGRFSKVELEAFVDSAKEVEIHLLNAGIRYEHRESRRSHHDAPEAILEFEWDNIPVRLSVYSHIVERSVRRNPQTGQSGERARIEALEALLQPSPHD